MRSRRAIAFVIIPLMGAALWLAWAIPPRPLTPREFVAYVRDPDHGLVKERTQNDLRLRLQYRPIEDLLLQEFGEPGVDWDSIQAARAGAHHFNLRFTNTTGADPLYTGEGDVETHNERLYYLTGLVEQDLSLVIGPDTLPCALAHLERTYGVVPYNELVLCFTDERQQREPEDLEVIYNDQAFGLGRVSFRILKSDLMNIPKLGR